VGSEAGTGDAQDHAQRAVAWVVAGGGPLRADVAACIAAEQTAMAHESIFSSLTIS